MADNPLFSIHCTTCEVRLEVRSEAAIGQILTCPKCGSMVEVAPPANWSPPANGPRTPDKPSPATKKQPRANEPLPAEKPPVVLQPLPAGKRPTFQKSGETAPRQMGLGDVPPSPPAERMPPTPASRAPSSVTTAVGDASSMIRGPKDQSPCDEIGEGSGPDEAAESWGLAPASLAPAELLWRKLLLLGTAPVVVAVIAVTGWALYSSRVRPEPVSSATETPPAPPPAESSPLPVAEPLKPPSGRLDSSWLPSDTRFVLSLGMSQLAGRDEFQLLLPFAGTGWNGVVVPMIQQFGLRRETIRRLTWVSTELAAWPDVGLLIVELEEGQDAEVFASAGEPLDVVVRDVACRRFSEGDWTHPFVVPDRGTIISGRENLLRELADRSEPELQSKPIERLLAAMDPEVEAMLLLDLDTARQAGWQLPTSLLDVWPAGRDPWRVAWEMPHAVGLSVRRSKNLVSELALACEGETAADRVRRALEELLPAATARLQERSEAGDEDPLLGQLDRTVVEPYRVLLGRASRALDSARCETVDDTVWARVDWGDEASPLIAAALESRPAMRAQWLAAARAVDEANHGRLLSGLSAFHEAKGRFPLGAGGGVMLQSDTRLSWIATMLPYYDQGDWHAELEFSYPWNHRRNRPVAQRALGGVVNPAVKLRRTSAGFPVTHYVGVAGIGADAGTLEPGDPRAGVFGFRRSLRLEEIRDGSSNTIAILGVTQHLGPWAQGGRSTVRGLTTRPYVNGPDGFGSGQPGGMLAGMADGSVRFLSADIDPIVLEQLATASGGERPNRAVSGVFLGRAGPRRQPDPAEPAPRAAASGTAKTGRPEQPGEMSKQPQPPATADARKAAGVDVEARLAAVLPDVNLPGIPLIQAIDLLSEFTGSRITLDTEAMARLGASVRDPVTVRHSGATLGEILEAVVASRGLTHVVEKGHILVTSPEQERSVLESVRYDISDLAGTRPEGVVELAGLLKRLVAPDTWRDSGGRGTIEAAGGSLNVGQTRAVHAGILTFCEKLRVARGLALRSKHDPAAFSLSTRFSTARAKLAAPISANFFEPTPLGPIVTDLERLSQVEILIDWMSLGTPMAADASKRVGTLHGPKGRLQVRKRPLLEALDELLDPLELGYRVVDAGTLEITTRRALADRLELEFYPIQSLLTGGATGPSVIERVQDTLAGSTWTEAGGPGVLYFDEPSAHLLVLQSQPIQFELERLLAQWRVQRRQ